MMGNLEECVSPTTSRKRSRSRSKSKKSTTKKRKSNSKQTTKKDGHDQVTMDVRCRSDPYVQKLVKDMVAKQVAEQVRGGVKETQLANFKHRFEN